MNRYRIIPSGLSYESAPLIDQQVQLSLEQQAQSMVEFDRTTNVSLAEVYDQERQSCTVFRPTFKMTYVYDNVLTGTTEYSKFRNELYYVNPQVSIFSKVWYGYPQYYEFDFYRDDINNTHINYKAVSAYSYNWDYYITYPSQNISDKRITASLNGSFFDWNVSDGIPFKIRRTSENGAGLISFECICPHGLSAGESVEIFVNGKPYLYRTQALFDVFSLGNEKFDSESHVFNIYNIGYTGNTFFDGMIGTFRRVVNASIPNETKSKYYVRQQKVILDTNGIILTKSGFEKNPFKDDFKLELSSITPNKITRISQKTSSSSYTFTGKIDINIGGLLDNQLRPVTELHLTIINKGYSGYFNKPFFDSGLKQGWGFNITNTNNSWWDDNNTLSKTNITTSSYQNTDGVTRTFYYNNSLKVGDIIDGDLCEWNDYLQVERVYSNYYQKIKYNQTIFKTTESQTTNSPGYYYKPHNPITLRTFSDYVETGSVNEVEGIPNYAYYSNADQEFRWRDSYQYGFIDSEGVGVDYPFMNNAQYPFKDFVFKLIPDNEGYNINDGLFGLNVPFDPIIDKCE